MKEHPITGIIPGSIAEEMKLSPGDILLSINGKEIEDVFDYHYMVNDNELLLSVRKANGEEWELEIEKELWEDLGLEFDQGLMDSYRACQNKCIFCFIDQMPKGMRKTLYFKDDDARLSFLQGNYITMTNLSKHDRDKILEYKLSPVNLSVQTTNPELRCKMLHNNSAGDILENIAFFAQGGLEMNGQIVLCKGWNDGAELERSLRDLYEFYPHMKGVSVVPVGLTKYREGLESLEPFSSQDAAFVLDQLKMLQEEFLSKGESRFVFPSDEWFLLAGEPLPLEDYYEGYGQLENGVGMIRSFLTEAEEAMKTLSPEKGRKGVISIGTGKLAYHTIRDTAHQLEKINPELKIQVYPIENRFFGPRITVAGLLTGQDIAFALKGESLGEVLLLPDTMLRDGEDVFLDDWRVEDLARALQTKVVIVKSDGESFVNTVFRGEFSR